MLTQSFVIPIVKVTDSCNYTCDFCYYSQNKYNTPSMDIELCKHIIKETYSYNAAHNQSHMRIIFHGGEPLLLPIDYYEEILRFEKTINENESMQISHSIQTNGYLLTKEWCSFLWKNEFDIGISIDGPSDMNYHYAKGSREKSYRTTLANIQMLNNNNIPYGIISVITNRHLNRARDFYDFCVANSFSDVSLNFCHSTTTNDSVSVIALKEFLVELFELYYFGDHPLNIREFNEILAKMNGYSSDTCATCNRENCGQYMSFDSMGRVFFCDTAYDKSTSIGDIKTASLYDIIDSTAYLQELLNSRYVYEKKCRNCSVNSICGSGCYRYDAGESNYFCDALKHICEYINHRVINL